MIFEQSRCSTAVGFFNDKVKTSNYNWSKKKIMNSLVALNELRAAKVRKDQTRSQCQEIKRQLEKINNLKREKAALSEQLLLLRQGSNNPEDMTYQDSELRELNKALRLLQEKISAYRIIGPSGLTVIERDANNLVVSFTSTWRYVTESYILKVNSSDGQIKVSSTTIPYFIDVQSMLNNKNQPLNQMMDNIGYQLNAYIQRKGELDFVMKDCANVIKTSSANDSMTTISLILVDKQTSTSKKNSEISIFLVYSSIESLLPETVDVTKSIDEQNCVTILLNLKKQLLEQPLSSVITALASSMSLI